jgi:hypothetical protein
MPNVPNKIKRTFALTDRLPRAVLDHWACCMTMHCQFQTKSATLTKRSLLIVCAVMLAVATRPALAGCGGALLTTATDTVQFLELPGSSTASTSQSAAQAAAKLAASNRAVNAGLLQSVAALANAGSTWQGPFSPLEASAADSSWQGSIESLASDSNTIIGLDAASLLTAESNAQAAATAAISIQAVPEPGTALLAVLTLTIALVGSRAARRRSK